MFRMNLWQWAIVLAAALAPLAYMAYSIARMFPADPQGAGTIRPSTPIETGLVGAEREAGQRAFDGWSYRVQGRYAGRVRVTVDADSVSIAGPRIPFGLYSLWIWLQGLTLALVPAALVWALVAWNWRPLLVGLGLLFGSTLVMAIGAGIWPGFGELVYAGEGHFDAIEVPRESVGEVKVGEDWARDGMQTVLVLYKRGIDQLATNTVTFRAPDGEGHDVCYAIQMLSREDAEELAALLNDPGAAPAATREMPQEASSR